MINRLVRPLPAPRRLLLGLAIALVVALAVRGTGRGRNAMQTATIPARLPVDAAVALLDGNEGSSVLPAVHVDSSATRLEFAPPPLSSSRSLPPGLEPELTQPSQAIRRLPTPQPEPLQPPLTTGIDSTRRAAQEDMVMRNASPLAPVRPVTLPAPMRPPVVAIAPPQSTVATSRSVEESASPPAQVAAAPSKTPLVPTMAAPRQSAPRRSIEWQRQMTPVAARADAQIRAAFETCGRGALFAGRSEMIQALRLIAQNADSLERGSTHSDALAAGMRAMAEAESFAPRGSRLESELDMATLVASHRTPVVREALAGVERGQKITPLEAQNRYYTYAQQQLAEATAGLPVGAIALYGLGKIHNTLATADSDAKAVEEPQAMTLYQAALTVDPGNPLAAHELGVMLARYQRYDEALAMLQHSAMIASLPETWQNLAVVHAQRGEADLARRARQEADNARTRLSNAKPASHPALARGSVRWLNASEFAQLRPGDTNLRPAGDGKTTAAAPAPTPETSKPSGVLSWLPWTTKR